MNQISFNSGRSYTEFGQRIVARRLECGAIAMVDVDRCIDYLLPSNVALTKSAIMDAYDHENIIYPTDVNLSYQDYYAVLRQLREVAQETTSV